MSCILCCSQKCCQNLKGSKKKSGKKVASDAIIPEYFRITSFYSFSVKEPEIHVRKKTFNQSMESELKKLQLLIHDDLSRASSELKQKAFEEMRSFRLSYSTKYSQLLLQELSQPVMSSIFEWQLFLFELI